MKKDVEAWVRQIVAGERVGEAVARLAARGLDGVRAALCWAGPFPPGRDHRDVIPDLDGVLFTVAARDVGALLAALDEFPDRVDTIARALGASRTDQAVAALLRLLREGTALWPVVQALRQIGMAEGLAPLPALLGGRASYARLEALEAVAEYFPPGSEAALREFLAREDLAPGELRIATEALATLESGPPARALSPGGPFAPAVRRIVAGEDLAPDHESLSAGGVSAVNAVLDGYRLPVPEGRSPGGAREALDDALSLSAMKSPAPLIEALPERPDGAAAVARALARSRDEAAVDALVGLLRHESPLVRRCAVWSLARIGTPRATDPLPGLLEDPSAAVRLCTLQVVAWQLPQETLEALRTRTDLLPSGRKLVGEALARLNPPPKNRRGRRRGSRP